jgi:hypothetical protein
MRGRLGTAVASCFVVVALVLVPSPPASAGGATLDFQREHYAPGDEVYGRTAVWLGASVRDLRDAPFFAYLLPPDTYIRPPHIPSSAIPIGPLRVRRIQSSTGRPHHDRRGPVHASRSLPRDISHRVLQPALQGHGLR